MNQATILIIEKRWRCSNQPFLNTCQALQSNDRMIASLYISKDGIFIFKLYCSIQNYVQHTPTRLKKHLNILYLICTINS